MDSSTIQFTKVVKIYRISIKQEQLSLFHFNLSIMLFDLELAYK